MFFKIFSTNSVIPQKDIITKIIVSLNMMFTKHAYHLNPNKPCKMKQNKNNITTVNKALDIHTKTLLGCGASLRK